MKLQLFNDGFRIACNDKFFVGRDDVNSDLAVRRGDLLLLAANALVGFVIELDAEVFHVGADALAQGILVLAFTFVVVNTLVDVLYTVADPRIKFD